MPGAIDFPSRQARPTLCLVPSVSDCAALNIYIGVFTMSLIEKLYSVFAVLFAGVFLITLFTIPEARSLEILLPVGLAGVFINIGLMFIVLRDILYREFSSPAGKYVWICIILIFWPAVLYYLPKYGFRARKTGAPGL
jgi:hypothetical protein